MELLILFLLSPAVILAQRYHGAASSGSANPNDEPFLPIYPVFPYNPKLIKRGTERDIAGQLTPELYAPKLDARDSYTASFGAGNYQRDPYYPSYNPYPKAASVSGYPTSTSLPNSAYTSPVSYPATATFAATNSYTSPVSSAYSPQGSAAYSPQGSAAYSTQGSAAYTTPNAYAHYGAAYTNSYPYSPSPYGIYNSYSTPYAGAPSPYPASPYVAGSYPNYNYQAPYYYPNYYNQPYPPAPPPPPPHSGQDYPDNTSSEDSSESDSSSSGGHQSSNGKKKSESRKNKYKDNDSDNSGEAKDGQFVDGGNFLSSGSKDLDGQPSTYKTPSAYNSLEQLSEVRLRSVPIPGIPRTTYRVISVGGQPVGADYPLPSNYAKVQQLEQIMSQTLARLLAQNAAHQAAQSQYQHPNDQQTDAQQPGEYGSVNKPQNVIAKTGLAYVAGPSTVGKVANGGQYFGSFGNRQNPLVIKVQNPSQVLQSSTTLLSKAAAKYAEPQYGQKSVTTVTLQQSPGVYIPPEAKNNENDETSAQSAEFGDYDSQPPQNYDGTVAANGSYKKNEQSYSLDPYHSSNLVTVQTPQAQSYQYSSYLPTQPTQQQQQQQQQSRDYKTSVDNAAFGNKRTGKE